MEKNVGLFWRVVSIVQLHQVDHGVYDGGHVLAERLAWDEAHDGFDDLEVEFHLVGGIVVVWARDDANEERYDQVQIVIFSYSFELLNHLKGFLANL